ncbi:MAG: HAMP domain-containing histidine kinase [Pelatocladus maniniholoensis HA4357-MV3]|jgi:two-component system NtrC family sensor kinase|uniref:histidine kinase n=1 Tax=Pelatocladus maniniholoensis HA4357-MV3 TaxID=1117104 RepID=A0A9E3HBB7_9NOST|nr:HAMP domain-containing histidine kinase [Pelatocladus maniniholoensis HA4357-MV3]BAZ69744.1 integral membrane sensor signal transduction histidine kinase [Fischerella sp. NIES-4106]
MTPSSELKQSPEQYHNLVKRVFHLLSIRQKIILGYGLTLGVAVLGTTAGLLVGKNHFQQARHQMIMADEESHLFSTLQGELLEIQSYQQEILPLLNKMPMLRQKTSEFKTNLAEAETLFSQLEELSQSTSQTELQAFIKKNQGNIKLYFQEFQTLVGEILSLASQPQNAAKAQKLIQQFAQSQTALDFYEFTHELNKFAKTVRDRQQEADQAQNKANVLQAQIIIGSILLSTAIAVILAIYTSIFIVRPLQTLTQVAQKVTQESNFDLQASVTTKDEVGTLADSLNQLIQQVKYLLKAQNAEAEERLIQSEKLSSLGRMIAGIAHEINNPVNFIYGNLGSAKTYINDLFDLLQIYKTEFPHPNEAIQAKEEEIDFVFIAEDLPKLLKSMEFGAERTREIIRSLKDFSRLDNDEAQSVNLHTCIDSTLLILQNRLKKGIQVVCNYGEIQPVTGYTGLLYQVFMNLLINAIDALEDKMAQDSKFVPVITISTELMNSNWVVVRITDNGSGIPKENQDKIFETFFTTKPRGLGTGLGLAITHQIIVEKHGGKLTYNSELNSGTEFAIALPVG